MSAQMDYECEPGSEPPACNNTAPGSSSSAHSHSFSSPPFPPPTLVSILLSAPLNAQLAAFLPTRDLFFMQFLNRDIFTLLNSNAQLLQLYYCNARLDSFIPFMVDDNFLTSFLTPTFIDLGDGNRAVRNTYSMHIKHLCLSFCTRISNRSMQCIATHVGANLLSLNLEGGGRSRINEAGMRTLFAACTQLRSINLNGCYQLNMVDTMSNIVRNCEQVLELSLNGCSQMNDAAIQILCRLRFVRKLELNCSNVTDLGLQQIATTFKNELVILHVGYCGAITDRGIATLVNCCRNLQDLNLYGCYGLSRHALSYLRLCPLLHTVDISRIHALDDSSIAEWILPTTMLQTQQQIVYSMVSKNIPGGAAAAQGGQVVSAALQNALNSHPEYNANLPQIFAAQSQHHEAYYFQGSAVSRLRSLSLDSCSRVSALGLKLVLDHCPSIESMNAFGIANLTTLGLQSLLKIVREKSLRLREMEVGGCTSLNMREVELLRNQFPEVKF